MFTKKNLGIKQSSAPARKHRTSALCFHLPRKLQLLKLCLELLVKRHALSTGSVAGRKQYDQPTRSALER
jgi:hypothetical protein